MSRITSNFFGENKMFYEKLQKLAKEKGKSFAQIEKDLGMSKNSMYNYKKNNPTATRLNDIAEYFGVTTDYLLDDTENQGQTYEYSVIQRRAKEMTPEQQKELLSLMEKAFDKLDKGELHLDDSDEL